jgi:hypothetical protein
MVDQNERERSPLLKQAMVEADKLIYAAETPVKEPSTTDLITQEIKRLQDMAAVIGKRMDERCQQSNRLNSLISEDRIALDAVDRALVHLQETQQPLNSASSVAAGARTFR